MARATDEGPDNTKKKQKPKTVRSDLKEVIPERPHLIFPHDLEQTSPSRKDRHPLPMGARSDHVPHAIPRGDNERRGGRDRIERKRHGIPERSRLP